MPAPGGVPKDEAKIHFSRLRKIIAFFIHAAKDFAILVSGKIRARAH
jgi:hypothetical protein